MKRTLLIALFAAVAAASAVGSPRDAYVLHMGGMNTISGSLEQMQAVSRQLSGEYLWVRRGGAQYVITDRALLAEVWDFFAPQRALRPQQRDVADKIRTAERESDALEDAQDDRKLTSAQMARLDELHATERELSRRERDLDEREEALDRVSEKKMWQLVDDAIRSGAARAMR